VNSYSSKVCASTTFSSGILLFTHIENCLNSDVLADVCNRSFAVTLLYLSCAALKVVESAHEKGRDGMTVSRIMDVYEFKFLSKVGFSYLVHISGYT
jgi:hypothetical protein